MQEEEFVFKFGKYKGKTLDDLSLEEINDYMDWLNSLEYLHMGLREIKTAIINYLDDELTQAIRKVEIEALKNKNSIRKAC